MIMALLMFLALIILLYALYTYWLYKDLPPGPYGLPFIGYVPFLGKLPPKTFKKLAQKYGNIYSLNLANETVVVVNDMATLKEVLVKQGNIFCGRPYIFILSFMLERKEIMSGDGPAWKEQKQLSLKILQDLGMGKSSMENIIMEEVESLTEHLKVNGDKPVKMTSFFFNSVLNTIWHLAAGKRLDATDLTVMAFQQKIQQLSRVPPSIAILNLFPALRFIAPDLTNYTALIEIKQIICNYIRQEVHEHKEKHQENSSKDFIDSYLTEIKNQRIKNQKAVEPYTEDHLIYTIFILFGAGTDTTNNTLSWAILYMAHHPDIQEKVQKELDNVIGENSYLPLTSRTIIPYTEATIMEILRLSSVTPMGMSHYAMKDTSINGYKIPKGTTVLTNLWGLHHDDDIWGDPHNFRPERFLDESGRVRKDKFTLLPFSAGPRLCLGEGLARMEIFLFFTCMLHRFSFQFISGQTKPSCEPIFGATIWPKEYSVVVKPR